MDGESSTQKRVVRQGGAKTSPTGTSHRYLPAFSRVIITMERCCMFFVLKLRKKILNVFLFFKCVFFNFHEMKEITIEKSRLRSYSRFSILNLISEIAFVMAGENICEFKRA